MMIPSRIYRLFFSIVILLMVTINNVKMVPLPLNFTLSDLLNINNLSGTQQQNNNKLINNNNNIVTSATSATNVVANNNYYNNKSLKNFNNFLEEQKKMRAMKNNQTASTTAAAAASTAAGPTISTTKDLELSESGYIFRSDQHTPPMLIKLGSGDDDKFNSMLKKAGIQMPKNGITYSSSSYEHQPHDDKSSGNVGPNKYHFEHQPHDDKSSGNVGTNKYHFEHQSHDDKSGANVGPNKYPLNHGYEQHENQYHHHINEDEDDNDDDEEDHKTNVRPFSTSSPHYQQAYTDKSTSSSTDDDDEDDQHGIQQDKPINSNYGNTGNHGNNGKIREDEEVTYSYNQEPITFEYVSHSADDDGYEILMEKLRNRGPDEIPSDIIDAVNKEEEDKVNRQNINYENHDDLEEIYIPSSKSNGQPLYQSQRTFEGYDQGSPSLDFKLDTKSGGLSKSFIAPIFDLPETYDTSFDRHTPKPKYTLKSKPKFTAPILADHHIEEDHHDYHGDHDDHDDHHHGGHHEDHGFEKGGGGSYDNAHHSNHGDKHDHGYKDYNKFDTKEKNKYDKEEDKGFYNDKDGHKKHHYNEGDKYGEHHNKKKGVKGNKYGSSGYHKKGHKTSGYHNTFHKDEYKKEHKFYDDKKKEGFFDKFGDFHKKHGAHNGGKHEGGFHESGYDEKHKGKDGLYDKGFIHNQHKGHDDKSGHTNSFSNFDNFDKNFGHDEEKKFGFGDSHLGSHHY